MIPAVITDHVEQAADRLTSMFADRRVIEAMLRSYIKRIQRIEDELWKVINARDFLGTPAGIVLDILGQIVGEARDSRTDADYLEAIRIRILINKSSGKTLDLMRILNAAARGAWWDYWDDFPAGFGWAFGGSASAWKALKKYMKEAKGGGIGASGYYLPTASVEKGLRYSSTVGTAPLARPYGSTTLGGPDTVYAHTGA
jgi:hypothetical protein